jgi:hypothetical protein
VVCPILDEVAVWVAHVAPQFRRMNFRLSDKFRAQRRPKIVVADYVSHAKVQKDAKNVGIAWRRSHNFRLVVGPAASAVNSEPNIAEPQKRRLTLAQYCGAEDGDRTPLNAVCLQRSGYSSPQT